MKPKDANTFKKICHLMRDNISNFSVSENHVTFFQKDKDNRDQKTRKRGI
jgi:hypothetical protein